MDKNINSSGRYSANCLVSISIAIVAVLVAHTIGIMLSFCIQGAAAGVAILLLSLSYFLRHNGKEVPKECEKIFCLTEYAWAIALCCLLPMIILVPIFTKILKIGDYFHRQMDYIGWRNYALMFSAAGVVILTIVKLIKYKKHKQAEAMEN